MTMKVRLKMKNRYHRYNINRPRPRHGHKCTKCKICLSILMNVCINPHMHKIFLQLYCMKWVTGDSQKEILN